MPEPMSATAKTTGGIASMEDIVGFGRIETAFRAARDNGRKLLVPFVTGGVTDDWLDVVRACAAAGADAIEIGIPFSDPVMDGPVIQDASVRALARGATPVSVLHEASQADVGIPLVAMTAYNIAFRMGHARYARLLVDNGVSGTILPDLSLGEADDWMAVASAAGVENVLLASPTSSDDRLARISAASRGWVYGVGTLGVTGERATLAASASIIATRLKACTDRPVLIGIGISNGEQAAEVAAVADGVIVGASVMRRVLAGEGPDGVARFVGDLRAALDDVV
jgi:tryptophan synthase alpha chain